MTFTYSSTDISTDLAKTRLRLGDTDGDDPILTDEEVNHFLGQFDSIDRATLEAAKAMIAQPEFLRATDRNGTGFSASRSQKFQHLKDLIVELKASSRMGARPTLTGGSVSGITSVEANTDYVPAAFGEGLNDNNQDG